jgi:hypothetical protein
MNNEKGQALPMAIMALAIGALVVVPFLSHAGTSLLDSGIYAGEIAARNASDAGVEHAIWNLTEGGLAATIPNVGNQNTYQLGETLNGNTVTLTVTTKAVSNGGGGTLGDITNTVIDNYNFDISYCNNPDMILINGDIYGIAYQGVSGDGFLKTVEITPDGIIANSTIDTLEYDTADGTTPEIIHVSGSVYAIAYTSTGNDGFLKTVTIDNTGNIGNAVIDTLEFDASNGNEPYIVFIAGIYYAIAYRGAGNDGFICTVTIDAAGNIGNAVIDTLEYDTADGYEPDVIQVSGSTYAIAYRGQSSDGFIKTVTIAANGAISDSVIDTLEFNTVDGFNPDIVNISGTVYAIAYQSTNSDGFLTTMTISAAGAISDSTINTYEFDPLNGQEPRILYLTGNVYGIVYHGPQDDGFFITLPIEANGAIPGTKIDTLEYDTSNGYFPDILRISESVLAVAYCIPSNRGSLVTIGFSTGDFPVNTYEIVSTAGDTTIRALVDTQNSTATINSWFVNQ